MKQIATTGDIAGRAYANQALKKFKPLLQVAEVLVQKYDVVVTNPPYFGSSRFSPVLDKYVKKHYKEVKSDLSMTMYQKALRDFVKPNGFVAFITTTSWMFLSSFEKLRQFLNEHYSIYSIVDFGTELFDGKVGHNPIVAWVTRNLKVDYKMTAVRLVEFCYSRRDEKEPEFFNEENRYTAQQSNFSKIPGSPVAYWVSEKVCDLFLDREYSSLKTLSKSTKGIITGDNDRFLRFWWELKYKEIFKTAVNQDEAAKSEAKWFPCCKGGNYRKWYGNKEYVIDWEDYGFRIINMAKFEKRHSQDYYDELKFQPGISWSSVTSSKTSFRYEENNLIEHSGMALFPLDDKKLFNIFGFLNSNISEKLLEILSPTINVNAGEIGNLLIRKDINNELIDKLVQENITISCDDWNSDELSWEYGRNQLI